MQDTFKLHILCSLIVLLLSFNTMASSPRCADVFKNTSATQQSTVSISYFQQLRDFIPTVIQKVRAFVIDKRLDVMGYMKGLPKYLKILKELKDSGRYLQYRDFGEMGLAELGISVRVNQQKLEGLDTGRPLIIVANHPLGIADGLSLQYLSSRIRQNQPSLLMLARWIEKLLPNAVFGDTQGWGTAIPIEINRPSQSDPLYESKIAEVQAFNSQWSRTSLRQLRRGAAVIVFPAGQVASIQPGHRAYPHNVYDAPGSWKTGWLDLAKIGRADIVFAQIDSVNSQAFYQNRKRFGGGDKERVIWFFSEALGKRDQAIDVYLSDPLSLDAVQRTLSETYGIPRAEIEADARLTSDLMRQFTLDLNQHYPQELNRTETPQRLED